MCSVCYNIGRTPVYIISRATSKRDEKNFSRTKKKTKILKTYFFFSPLTKRREEDERKVCDIFDLYYGVCCKQFVEFTHRTILEQKNGTIFLERTQKTKISKIFLAKIERKGRENFAIYIYIFCLCYDVEEKLSNFARTILQQ